MEELVSLQQFAGSSGLSEGLIELLRTYVALRNNCIRNMDAQIRRARARGEALERICALPTWRRASVYDSRECAAFAWADCVMRPGIEASDSEYSGARSWFTEPELVDLTAIIVLADAWNRLVLCLGDRRI
jgi:alkylhydroperoxidase family enzyme